MRGGLPVLKPARAQPPGGQVPGGLCVPGTAKRFSLPAVPPRPVLVDRGGLWCPELIQGVGGYLGSGRARPPRARSPGLPVRPGPPGTPTGV